MHPSGYSRIPRIKTLQTILSTEAAKLVRDTLTGKREPIEAEDWVRKCYFDPNAHEKRMNAVSIIMQEDGMFFGVEFMRRRDGTCSFEYVNSGDSYKPTLLYRTNTRAWSVGCWGDGIR